MQLCGHCGGVSKQGIRCWARTVLGARDKVFDREFSHAIHYLGALARRVTQHVDVRNSVWQQVPCLLEAQHSSYRLVMRNVLGSRELLECLGNRDRKSTRL